jgi:phosphatidylinositol alpha-1,6-mannosyltransferase
MTAARQQLLAAPTLGEAGGGVGQVAQAMWTVMRESWPSTARLATLGVHGSRPALAEKIKFGSRLAAGQITGRTEWILFAHVGLTRALRAVPPALRAPYAVFLHGVECWQPLPAADRQLIRDARVRLCNSAFTAARAGDANPGIGDVVICQLSLPAEAIPARIVPPPERPRALIVGRMAAGERYKGHDQLIDAWPEVARRVPGAELVIAGDGDDRPRLEARAHASAAGGNTRFTGFVEGAALARLYDEASVFVLPSRGEGFGLVYLEAMAHGRACVASTHDAAGEIVIDGETGLLVDLDAPQSLADAIVRLLTDHAFRDACGDAGRRRLETCFTRDRFAAQLRRVLQDAFGPGAAPVAAPQVTT